MTKRILLSVRTAVLVLFAAGCGFHAVGNGDGSSGGDDLGASMDELAGGGADLYCVPPGTDLASASGGGCTAPLLLIGVENLHNGDTGGGRVARLSLTASGQKSCTTLRGQGLIAPQPLAVAAFTGGVAAATRDGIYVIDPVADTIRWSKPAPSQTTWLPIDAFSILTPTGTPVIAVAYGPSGNPSSIRELDAFDENGVAEPGPMPWCIQGSGCTALPLSLSILSMSANPADLTHLVALDSASSVAAWDVDPWAATKTQYVGTYSEPLGSIYAVVAGGKSRLAWFDNTTNGAVQYALDSGSGPSAIGGPILCNGGCATILHVVPDPTTADNFFLLCDGATIDARTVVRMDASRTCTTILDGHGFGAESRLSRLGIVQ
ncbi:MAG: hypothetical protein JWM53_4620 [bacterium]|nr:hypothetical protein [bacterium]